MPDVRQLLVAVVEVADDQRPEGAPTRAGADGVTADHELVAVRRLDLEPGLRALAALVTAVAALGDDAFHAVGFGRLEQGHAVFGERLDDAQPLEWNQARRQQRLA